MVEQYIKVFEWILRHPELTALEALIVSHVIRYGINGCFQSNATLGRLFKKHPRQIQRIIKLLTRKGWLAPLYPKRQERIIYATPKEPPLGPLFDYKQQIKQTINNAIQDMIKQTAKNLSV